MDVYGRVLTIKSVVDLAAGEGGASEIEADEDTSDDEAVA